MPDAADYAQVPFHPLRRIPQSSLDMFRSDLREILATGDVIISDESMIEPVADALLMSAVELLAAL